MTIYFTWRYSAVRCGAERAANQIKKKKRRVDVDTPLLTPQPLLKVPPRPPDYPILFSHGAHHSKQYV
jgi:hypothetical protein